MSFGTLTAVGEPMASCQASAGSAVGAFRMARRRRSAVEKWSGSQRSAGPRTGSRRDSPSSRGRESGAGGRLEQVLLRKMGPPRRAVALLALLLASAAGVSSRVDVVPHRVLPGDPPPGQRQRHGCHNPNDLALVETSVPLSGTPGRTAGLRGVVLGAEGAGLRVVALGASFGPRLPRTQEEALRMPLALLPDTPTPPPHFAASLPSSPSPAGQADPQGEDLPGLSLACPPHPELASQALLGGSAVVVRRGNCSFLEKALTAQKAGALALLVANTEDDLLAMGCNDSDAGVEDLGIAVLLLARSSAMQLLGAMNSSEVQVALYAPPRPLLDPSEAVLWALAVSLLLVASWWAAAVAREEEGEHKREGATGPGDAAEGQRQAEGTHEISLGGAVSFVFVSSAVLLLLFFFMSPLVFDGLLFFFCLMAFEAVSFCLSCLLYFWAPEALWGRQLWAPLGSLPLVGPVSAAALACATTSVLLVLLWVLNRHSAWAWALQDLFGSCLILTVLQSLRLPNIKVSTVLLVLAFLYDIFWVFISPLFFSGESVMVEVASGRRTGGEALPLVLVAPRLLGPWGGASILGLGDVVLPGLLVVFTRRFDLHAKRHGSAGYFVWTITGYALGLLTTYAALVLMDGQGQPALLYLVPGTLGVVVVLGWRRGEWQELWASQRRSTRQGEGSSSWASGASGREDEESRPAGKEEEESLLAPGPSTH